MMYDVIVWGYVALIVCWVGINWVLVGPRSVRVYVQVAEARAQAQGLSLYALGKADKTRLEWEVFLETGIPSPRIAYVFTLPNLGLSLSLCAHVVLGWSR